jgi:tetratricopeptide (TPR) repeat protein
MGRKLALVIALLYVTVCYVGRGRAPHLQDALVLLFMTATALSASAALCYDHESTQQAADVLEPFGAFGATNAAGFSYEVSCGLAAATLDNFGASYALWQRVVARLASKSPIPGMPDNLRVRYQSGLEFSMGVMDSQRDDDRSLRAAARLDEMGAALYPMNTDQLRATYYAHQGNGTLYRHHRELSEQRAIQQGAIWQNETWALLVESIASHRHRDAMAMKRVAEQLRSASKVVPTLAVYADRSRGTYLLLRERYSEALVWLERCLDERPRFNFAWGRSHGVLARAYNELGRHDDARAACRRVLDLFTPGDLAFPGLTLLIETELLVAEAGLGNTAQALVGLQALLAKHAPNGGPLTHGELHETGIRISLLAAAEADARVHLQSMRHWYGITELPSLLQHCEAVAARVDSASRAGVRENYSLPTSLRAESTMSSAGFATSRDLTFAQFASRLLRSLADQSGGARGFLYRVDEDASCIMTQAFGQDQADRAVERWMFQCVADEIADDTTAQAAHDDQNDAAERDRIDVDGWHYRLHLLWSNSALNPRIFAAAIIGSETGTPARCSPHLLQAMATQLSQVHLPETTTASAPP